jgi:hypothetical protein
VATLCGVTGSSGGRWIGVWIVVLMLVLGACTTELSDEIIDLTTTSTSASETTAPTTSAVTTTTVVATTTTSPEDLEAELMRVLTGARFAYLDARADPSADASESLRMWSTERNVELVQSVLAEGRLSGTATRLGSVETLELLSYGVDGDAATVVYCSVSDAIVYSIEDGAIIDDRLGYATVSADMLFDAGWKVDRLIVDLFSLEESCVA